MLGKMLGTLGTTLLDLLIPPRCEVCNTLQEPVLCDACLAQFTPITEPYCAHCGLPLDPLARQADCCVQCRTSPPAFAAARAAAYYRGTLRRAVHLFKYAMTPSLATPLGKYMAAHLVQPFPVDCLCPVPLHPTRERMRGFNQSLLLAECLAAHWQVPIEHSVLQRTQDTTPQMLLPVEERRRNVKGAFAAEHALHGECVGLVDDVLTTGSTLHECSRVLLHAGAGQVVVFTLARTVMQP